MLPVSTHARRDPGFRARKWSMRVSGMSTPIAITAPGIA
jgi:hypothetical protein